MSYYKSIFKNLPFPCLLFEKKKDVFVIKEANTYYCEVKNQFVVYMLSSSVEDFNNQAKKYPFVSGFLSKPLKISYLENILKDNFVKVKPLGGLVVRSYERVKE